MRIALLLLVGLSRLMAADAARDARWRQDLDTLTTQLPALHPNLFFQTPRSQFDRAAADLRAAISDLSDTQVMVGLARIVALPGDGHTSLSLTQRNSVFHFLPVQFRWFDDGLFVTAASQGYARVLGNRVIQIGDRPLEEAYQAVSALISHENDIWVRRVQRDGSDLAGGSVQVAAAAPGLFPADALNPASPGAVLDQDSRLVTGASPARRGSVIQIYATGQGATDPPVEDGAARGTLPPAQSRLVPRVYFAGELAEVLFTGLHPAFPGLWQITCACPNLWQHPGKRPSL